MSKTPPERTKAPTGFQRWDKMSLKRQCSEAGKSVPAEKRFFSQNPEAAKAVASLGGKMSKRGPNKPKIKPVE